MREQVIIIGAGPAGLSCAIHLQELGLEPVIFEKESRPGGLLRTEAVQDKFFFDYAGHLLHFRSPEIENWLKEIVGEKNLTRFKRRSFIYYHDTLTPYPFQVHTYKLPASVILDCVLGLIKARLGRKKKSENFKDWILAHFGKGFARHFFFPFNQKFWKINLEELTSEWAEWSIPKPSVWEVVKGGLGLNRKDYGYNIWFYYPKSGGIELIPQKLAQQVRKIFLNREIIAVHLKNRKILLDNGEEIGYNYLVSTMPLRELILRISDIPEALRQKAEKLRYISVLCVNIGFRGPKIPEYHWVYFPEEDYIFYRAGLYCNFFQPQPEFKSMVLEISYLPDREPGFEEKYMERAISDFQKTGLLTQKHQIEYAGTMKIPYAYVVYDQYRSKVLPELFEFLRQNRVYSIGRYGRWQYSTTEDALLDGKKTAQEIAQWVKSG